MEVKSVMAENHGIREDLQKLTYFRNEIGYQRALYLIYGANPERALQRVRDAGAAGIQLAAIEIWAHVAVGIPAVLSAQ